MCIFKHIESFKYPGYTLEFQIPRVLLEMAPKLGESPNQTIWTVEFGNQRKFVLGVISSTVALKRSIYLL